MIFLMPIFLFLQFTTFSFICCEGINSVSSDHDNFETNTMVIHTPSFKNKLVIALNTTQATSNNETGLKEDHPATSKNEYSTTTSKV